MAAFGPSQSVSPNAAMAWRHDSEEFLVQQPEGPVYDKLLGVVSWADFVSMANATSTSDGASTDWESVLIAKARGDVPDWASTSVDEQGDSQMC